MIYTYIPYICAHIHTDRQAGRQAGRQKDSVTDTQTHRHTHTHMNTYIHIYIYTHTYIHICTSIYIYIYTYICVCVRDNLPATKRLQITKSYLADSRQPPAICPCAALGVTRFRIIQGLGLGFRVWRRRNPLFLTATV